jgi:hypothetical protein
MSFLVGSDLEENTEGLERRDYTKERNLADRHRLRSHPLIY